MVPVVTVNEKVESGNTITSTCCIVGGPQCIINCQCKSNILDNGFTEATFTIMGTTIGSVAPAVNTASPERPSKPMIRQFNNWRNGAKVDHRLSFKQPAIITDKKRNYTNDFSYPVI